MVYFISYQLIKGRKVIKEDSFSSDFNGEEKDLKNRAMQLLFDYLDHDPFLEGTTAIKIVDIKRGK
jgi:hypothetical protein